MKHSKILALLLCAALLTLCLAACGGGIPEVKGKTYVLESASQDGTDLSAMFEGEKYIFNEDGTCIYAASFEGETMELNGTYTQDGKTVTLTLEYEEGETGTQEFSVAGDTIMLEQTFPAVDYEGNELPGETSTTTMIYKAQ